MKITLLVLALSLAAAARADDYTFKEPFKQTGAFDANGEVSLENINGSVTVHTWAKNEILIEGEKSAKTEEELKQIDLTMDVSPASAAIKVKLPKRQDSWFAGNTIRAAVRFTLTVPAAAVLKKIDTVNSSVTIEGVRGSVHASSVNGAIHASDLGAGAHLRSVNGSIHASFASLAAHDSVDLETVNGSINVTLPKDAGLAFHGRVVNGNIDCDFPLLLNGGKIHGRDISGTIGDGRASLAAKSVNGSIRLKSL